MNILLPQGTGTGQVGMAGSPARTTYPVLYLLHGWSDDDSIWMRRTSIERYVADRGIIVIMPRVELSYYHNMATGMRFWDFIAEELPALCRQWFPISEKREETYAAGLSMGGYGAFRLGLNFPERYAAVASLSGALDIRELMQREQPPGRMARQEAIFGPGLKLLNTHPDLFNLCDALASLSTPLPRFYQWCGTEDFLYPGNRKFSRHATQVGLDLTTREGPGDHSWEHWDREIIPVLDWLCE